MRFLAARGLLTGGVLLLLSMLPALYGQGTQPLVAIHDSELTRALETMPATGATPTGSGTTSNQWWTTNWNYFVMPESLKETLRSDGTAFTVVRDSNILAGVLLTNGMPRYPILISLAAEAIRDDEIAAFTNYVAAGGFLFVGSSAFTRNTNGTSRGDFAFANAMGIHLYRTALTNWGQNNMFTKQAEHRLVSHIPNGTRTWRMPASAEEIPFGTSPSHQYLAPHTIWQVVNSNATVIAQGDAFPYLVVKPYGKGYFIYCSALQPLMGHGGWSPGMYAYGIFRNAIEWAFESAKLPVAKLSPWPFPYDAAFMVRHDLENYGNEISSIEASAQFENSLGAKGDYYFCTGTLRVELGNSATVVAGLRRAITNFGATVSSHNGGLRNPGNLSLAVSDFDYWHWGTDEALDTTPTNYPSGKAYAFTSLSNSFVDIETWLAGINTGPRKWVSCYFNSTREDSYDIQDQLNIKITGEQKLGPFPHWTLSTRTPGKLYPLLSEPLSDWFVGSQVAEVAQSLELHTSVTMREGVDYYYSIGALINFYSHTLSTGLGPAGSVATDYVSYGMNTNLHPRLWSANAVSIYNWWLQRSNAQVTVTHASTNGNLSLTTFQISGATDPATTVEMLLPAVGEVDGLEVLTNGAVASNAAWRTNGQVLKVLVGNSVTNALVRYRLSPKAQDDYYSVMSGNTLSVSASGVITNDSVGFGGTNLTAVLVSNVANGTLFLTNNGGFSYTPASNFVGSDFFSYNVFDGVTNSAMATAFLSVTPFGALFFDDFTRSPGAATIAPWQSNLGTWSVTNGALAGGSSVQDYGYAYVAGNWSDYAVQGTVRFTPGGYGGGLGGRLNSANGAHYAAWIYPEGSAGGSSVLKLVKQLGWTTLNATPMAQVALPGVGTNAHVLKLVFEGNRIRVSYDSVQYIDVTDTGFSGTGAYASGGITAGLWTYLTPYDIVVDDVAVTTLAGPPLANPDFYTATQNTQLVVSVPGVLLNDTGGSAPLSSYLLAGPTNGVLNLNSNGSFSYTPATNYFGNDAFTYRATDGITNSAPALVTITISSANQPPVANNDNYAVTAGGVLTIGAPGVLANDTDVNGDPLTALLVSSPTNGVLSFNTNGSFVYTPATNFTGSDMFTYRANDGTTNSGLANVTISVTAADALFADDFNRATNGTSILPWVLRAGTWSITNGVLPGSSVFRDYGSVYLTNSWTNYTVSCRLQLPVSAYGGGLGGCVNPATGTRYGAWVYPGSPGVLQLIKFQTWTSWGYNGSGFVPVAQVNIPAIGTNWHTLKLAFRPGRIAAYFDGIQVVSVTDTEPTSYLSGGVSLDMWTDLTAYKIQFDDVMVKPVAVDDSYTATENTSLTVPAPGVLANDTAVYGTSLLASLISSTTNGILTLNSNGGFTYNPATNFNGSDSFTYYPIDGTTNLGAVTVSLTVNPVNHAPVLPVQTNRAIAKLALLIVTNTATDADLPLDQLTYTLTVSPSSAAISTNGIITWTAGSVAGTNVFTTVVTDLGGLSATNSFSVVVFEANSAPVLPNQTNRTMAELSVLVVTNTASDPNLPDDQLTYQLTSSPAGAAISTNGIITWTPSEAQGPSTNTITTVVSDLGGLQATNSFMVTVTEVNEPPAFVLTPSNRTIAELTLLTVTNAATDPDLPANVLNFQLLNAPVGAVISSNGVITWTPSEAQGPSTNTIITVVSDGSASATNSFVVTVTEVNLPPAFVATPANRTINELTLLTLTNNATDPDLPPNILSYLLLNPPGGAVISSNGVITWTPSEAQGPSTNTITTVVNDGTVSVTNSFVVVVNEVNVPPVFVATPANRTILELTTMTVTNGATDSDLPANLLTYQLVGAPGGAVISSNGVITWTPTGAQSPSTNNIVTVVSDGIASATNSFVVTVAKSNSAPVFVGTPTNRTIAELTLMTVTNNATDSDLPANTLTYQLIGAPSGAVINTSGVITWMPTEAQGPSTNTITTMVDDGTVSVTNSFTVTVTEVNLPPVFVATPANRTLAELELLAVTNNATDSDLPANTVSYQLVNPPANATVNANGVIHWTPNVVQGPSTNTFTTVASDGLTSVTNNFVVTVSDTLIGTVTNPTLISTGAVWRYLDNGSDQGSAWREPGFNDAGWSNGPAQLGYGDGDEQTVVSFGTNSSAKYTTTYFRREFLIADRTFFSGLNLSVLRDDGVAVYLNGAEVYRDNLPAGPVTYQTLALVAVGGADETNFFSASLDAVGLVNGTNVVAVEIHQNSPTSSDLSFDLELRGVLNLIAPKLPVQPNRTIAELTTLTVTNTASDLDTSANLLNYQLVNAPGNAAISTNGIITWTPGENEGPGTNSITTVVDDGGQSATNYFTVTVNEVNLAPIFAATPANRTIDEQTLLTVTNNATDSDLPANTLTYQLVNPPGDALIGGNGVITWTPGESEGPGTNTIISVVNDGTVSVTNAFTVVVNEVNVAPVFVAPPPNVTIAELTTLIVTNSATDADLPANILTYQLLNPPGGASISPNGVITWPPGAGTAPDTNTVMTVVSDGALSATNSFTVVVLGAAPAPIIQSITRSNELVTIISTAVSGRNYRLQYQSSLAQTNWTDLSPEVLAVDASVVLTNSPGAAPERYYRVLLVPLP